MNLNFCLNIELWELNLELSVCIGVWFNGRTGVSKTLDGSPILSTPAWEGDSNSKPKLFLCHSEERNDEESLANARPFKSSIPNTQNSDNSQNFPISSRILDKVGTIFKNIINLDWTLNFELCLNFELWTFYKPIKVSKIPDIFSFGKNSGMIGKKTWC